MKKKLTRKQILDLFKIKKLHPYQEEAINTIKKQNYLLLIVATGGGKSIVYQLPALEYDGTTLIISPLIALMHDQVNSLKQKGIEAGYLDSTIKADKATQILTALNNQKFQIFYVAPERLANKNFKSIISRIRVPLVAIDEAHCISSWGHDFRLHYNLIGHFLVTTTPTAKVLACTATATQQVRDDIIRKLFPVNTIEQQIEPLDRANLSFRNVEIGSLIERNNYIDRLLTSISDINSLKILLKEYGFPTGKIQKFKPENNIKNDQPKGGVIIYAFTRKDAENEAERINKDGLKADYYHAGRSNSDRKSVEENFKEKKLDVIVATNAFGMGIDRDDIRFVIHLCPPLSIESYYQEAGRAGRDGQPAICTVFFGLPESDERADYLIKQREEKQIPNVTVQVALSAVARISKHRGLLINTIELLKGHKSKFIMKFNLHNTPAFSFLSDYSQEWISELLEACIATDYISSNQQKKTSIPELTKAGEQIMYGSRPDIRLLPDRSGIDHKQYLFSQMKNYLTTNKCFQLFFAEYFQPESITKPCGICSNCRSNSIQSSTAHVLEDFDSNLFKKLRAWRLYISREISVPPHVICTDQALSEIVKSNSQNKVKSIDDLSKIQGIGRTDLLVDGINGVSMLDIIKNRNEKKVIVKYSI